MPIETIYTLEESNISVSGGGQLSGITQGDGSHLVGLTITLNNNDWEPVDIDDNDANFADNDGSQRLEGPIVYDGVTYADNRRVESEFALTVETPEGDEFRLLAFNINEPGVVSFRTVEGLAFVDTGAGFPPIGVPLLVTEAFEFPSDSYDSLATPPCFTRGTLIETPQGPRPIETLSVGDTVITMDAPAQPILWIGSRHLPKAALQQNTKLRPIRVVSGALGQGLPKRDLLVSRQHRMLVSSPVAERMFDIPAVLVPAHRLTIMPGIYVDDQVDGVEYFHILLAQHQVIFAEGAPTESLYTGPEALKSLHSEAREEILTLFPELADRDNLPETTLPCQTGKRTTRLVERHLKNGKPLLDTYVSAV